jgi:hypothetical protein
VIVPPSGVYFTALDSRLKMIWLQRSLSATGTRSRSEALVQHELLPFSRHSGRMTASIAAVELPERVGLRVQRKFAALGARHVQHVVDEPQQELGGAVDLLEAVGRRGGLSCSRAR